MRGTFRVQMKINGSNVIKFVSKDRCHFVRIDFSRASFLDCRNDNRSEGNWRKKATCLSLVRHFLLVYCYCSLLFFSYAVNDERVHHRIEKTKIRYATSPYSTDKWCLWSTKEKKEKKSNWTDWVFVRLIKDRTKTRNYSIIWDKKKVIDDLSRERHSLVEVFSLEKIRRSANQLVNILLCRKWHDTQQVVNCLSQLTQDNLSSMRVYCQALLSTSAYLLFSFVLHMLSLTFDVSLFSMKFLFSRSFSFSEKDLNWIMTSRFFFVCWQKMEFVP